MRCYCVVIDKEDCHAGWLDRFRIDVIGKNWSLSIDPYINNGLKPWLFTFSGYNEWRDVDYYLLNVGWIIGCMFDFDKKRNGVWKNEI